MTALEPGTRPSTGMAVDSLHHLILALPLRNRMSARFDLCSPSGSGNRSDLSEALPTRMHFSSREQ